MSAQQTLVQSTATKVKFDTKTFDVGANYSTANYRWTPVASGPISVQLNAAVYLNEFSSTNITFSIYKNGTVLAAFANLQIITGQQSWTVSVNDQANGSSDYYEVFIDDAGTSLTLYNTAGLHWFAGAVL